MDLLQALHAAEFEELAIMHDITEALGKLSDDKGPDNSSTVSSNPSISPCPEFLIHKPSLKVSASLSKDDLSAWLALNHI